MTPVPAAVVSPLPPADWLLLSAAALAGDAGLTAWNEWQVKNPLESAGPGVQPLLGTVYANLGPERVGRQANLLKGVYKRNRYLNQVTLTQAGALLDRLSAQGVPALLLHDTALLAAYCPDLGCRPSRCIDLLLRREHRAVAAEAAHAEGWEARPEQSFGSLSTFSAQLFAAPGRRSLRIWSNLFAAEPLEDTESRSFRGARSVAVGSRDFAVAGPVEMLLCVAADAYRGKAVPLHTYLDAMWLVGAFENDEDWIRLVWQAQRYEHILPLRSLLSVIGAVAPGTTPAWVLPGLRKMAIAYSELLQFRRACDSRGLQLKSAGLRWYRRLRPRHEDE